MTEKTHNIEPELLPSESRLIDGLSATAFKEWLEGEIKRAEYPIGSLDISREDRAEVARHCRLALHHAKRLIYYGR